MYASVSTESAQNPASLYKTPVAGHSEIEGELFKFWYTPAGQLFIRL
jgi:hypothetical protein